MKAELIATTLIAFALAPGTGLAQSAPESQAPTLPHNIGRISVTTRAPEPDKWNAVRSNNKRVFKCKPLACSDPQTVSFTFLKSPTQHPDPKALEKFATVDLPKSIRAAAAAREVLSDGTENIETLKSETATLKTYPSVVNESKFSRGQHATFVETAIIFAGPLMIRIQSLSPNRELAQKALNEFIDVMRIVEGPPQSPSGPPATMPGLRQL